MGEEYFDTFVSAYDRGVACQRGVLGNDDAYSFAL
jgi:hypothetical protein